MDINGRRLEDTPIGRFPVDMDALQPGDYWLHQTHDGSRLLNVRDYSQDRAYWGLSDDLVSGNLTGLVLGCIDPLGHFGMLSIHTVRFHPEDNTVSVRSGDGSSNSILIKRRSDEVSWHGFIEHGRWHGGIEPPEQPPEAFL